MQHGGAPPPGRQWAFLTNHARVLWWLWVRPDSRMRDVAAAVGITERAAQRIVGELVEEGYVTRTRRGARNSYRVHLDVPMRHANHRDIEVGRLLELLGPRTGPGTD